MKGHILKEVFQTIHNHDMAPAGCTALVAHSGGPDSTALLHIMARLADELAIQVESVHYNHRLRPESADDASFAEKTAARLGLPFTMEVDHSPPSKQIQSEARKKRYAFFNKVAKQRNGAIVATGHTLDDSVETSIMWMLRGAGPAAFGGISPTRGIFIRPLIELRKSQTLQWLEEENLSYVIDKTNLTDKYLRNRIRSSVIPAMEKVSAQAVEKIARLARLTRQTGEAMEEHAGDILDLYTENAGAAHITFNPAFTANSAYAIRGMVYKQTAKRIGADPSALLERHITAIDQMARGGKLGRWLDLPGGMYVLLDHAGMTFGLKAVMAGPMEPTAFKAPMEMAAGGGALSVERIKSPHQTQESVVEANIPQDAVFRNRQPGDYLSLINLRGRKKLKKFFVDRKIPSSIRGLAPLLASGNQILWIPGYFIDASIMPSSGSKPDVALSWRPQK